MKRVTLWLVTVLGAFFLGRQTGKCSSAAGGRRGRGVPIGALLFGVAAGMARAWRTAVLVHEHRRPIRALETQHGLRGGVTATGDCASPSAGEIARPEEAEDGARAPQPPGLREPSPAVNAARQAADEPSTLARWWQYIIQLFQRYGKDQCPAFAAALSFFGLLSIVPVLLVAMAILGYLIDNPHQARMQIEHVVQQFLPGATARLAAHQLLEQIQIENQLATLRESRGLTGIIGVLTLVWASMQIFVNSVPAMNAAWEVPENRGWLKLRLVAFGLLLGAGGLFLLSLLSSSGPDMVRRLHIPWLGLPEHVPWYIDLLFTLLALAINAAMFTLIYRFLPAAEVTWKEAAVSGIAMGVMWEVAKQGFSMYLAKFGSHNAMYGALGGVMILVTWIYYTSMLLLLGAEVAKLYKDVCERQNEKATVTTMRSSGRTPAPHPLPGR